MSGLFDKPPQILKILIRPKIGQNTLKFKIGCARNKIDKQQEIAKRGLQLGLFYPSIAGLLLGIHPSQYPIPGLLNPQFLRNGSLLLVNEKTKPAAIYLK